MLIIAIPKSASTSVMETLGKLHKLPYRQLSLKELELPKETRLIQRFHSDIRELQSSQVKCFDSSGSIYKQHIPPTKNNIALLKSVKKVVLLRDPCEIINAYFRAEKKKLHRPLSGFKSSMSLSEWQSQASQNGLLEDLIWFNKKWREEAANNDENTLIISYADLVSNPLNTINIVEGFYEVKKSRNVKLSKRRYSNHNILVEKLLKVKSKLLAYIRSNNRLMASLRKIKHIFFTGIDWSK